MRCRRPISASRRSGSPPLPSKNFEPDAIGYFPGKSGSLAETHPRLRVVVTDGLTLANVVGAAEVVRPFGIDFTTGVEFSPDAEIATLWVRLSWQRGASTGHSGRRL
jgi:hypothetical protein